MGSGAAAPLCVMYLVRGVPHLPYRRGNGGKKVPRRFLPTINIVTLARNQSTTLFATTFHGSLAAQNRPTGSRILSSFFFVATLHRRAAHNTIARDDAARRQKIFIAMVKSHAPTNTKNRSSRTHERRHNIFSRHGRDTHKK